MLSITPMGSFRVQMVYVTMGVITEFIVSNLRE
jgi:hypothetical protein